MSEECQATPKAELERQVMDPNVPKNEREWWAAAEIERLRADNERLDHIVRPDTEQPYLGLATTRELLDELRARFEMHALGGLDYRTVDGERFAEEQADRVQTVSDE